MPYAFKPRIFEAKKEKEKLSSYNQQHEYDKILYYNEWMNLKRKCIFTENTKPSDSFYCITGICNIICVFIYIE